MADEITLEEILEFANSDEDVLFPKKRKAELDALIEQGDYSLKELVNIIRSRGYKIAAHYKYNPRLEGNILYVPNLIRDPNSMDQINVQRWILADAAANLILNGHLDALPVHDHEIDYVRERMIKEFPPSRLMLAYLKARYAEKAKDGHVGFD